MAYVVMLNACATEPRGITALTFISAAPSVLSRIVVRDVIVFGVLLVELPWPAFNW